MATNLWDKSGTIQWAKAVDERAHGAYAEFFLGGTTTPVVVYQDFGGGIPHSGGNRATVNADAIWPSVYFIADGNPINVRVYQSNGVLISSIDNVPNYVPAAGTIEPGEQVEFPVGFIMPSFTTGTIPDWVRLNGQSIGSSASAATERANDDVEPLFLYLWNALGNDVAPVSGGRGGSAAADWAANKTLRLPDCRGATLRGVDGMGNIDVETLAHTPFQNGNSLTVGSQCGDNSHILTVAKLPVHSHPVGSLSVNNHQHGAGTLVTNTAGNHGHGVTDPTHVHGIPGAGGILIQSGSLMDVTGGAPDAQQPSTSVYSQVFGTQVAGAATGIGIQDAGSHSHSISGLTSVAGASISGNTANIGADEDLNNADRSILVTWYIRYSEPAP